MPHANTESSQSNATCCPNAKFPPSQCDGGIAGESRQILQERRHLGRDDAAQIRDRGVGDAGRQATLNRMYDRARTVDLPFYSYLEMFAHLQRHQALYRALLSTGGEHLIFERLQGHVAAEVVREIHDGGYPEFRGVSAEVGAQFVTGAFARLTAWWFAQPSPATPADTAAISSLLSITVRRRQPDGQRRLNRSMWSVGRRPNPRAGHVQPSGLRCALVHPPRH